MTNRAPFENIILRQIEDSFADRSFIKHLFMYADVKSFYTLRDDHAADLDSFVDYLVEANRRTRGLHHIIETKDGDPAGFITAEPYRTHDGEAAWNIGFAVHPMHRNKGYARDAVNGLAFILSNFSIERMDLDIPTDDKPAEAVAKACGCEQLHSPTGGIMGFLDEDHPELGMRTCWVRKVTPGGKRDEFGNEAIRSQREKDYRSAITYYKEALKHPYQPGSPFTDEQILSNMAMAYSSVKRYAKAYSLLTKAWDMGCRNQSVSKELDWLRANAESEISRQDITDLFDSFGGQDGRMPRLKPAFLKEMMQDFQKIVRGNREDISIITVQAETLFVAFGHVIEYIDEGSTSAEDLKKVGEHLFKEAKAVANDLFTMLREAANKDTKEWFDKGFLSLVGDAFGSLPKGSSQRTRDFVREYHRRLNHGEMINPIEIVRIYLG